MISEKTLFVLCVAFVLHHQMTALKFSRQRHGYRLHSNAVLNEYQNVSSLMCCLAICNEQYHWVTASYKQKDQICLISDITSTFTKHDKFTLTEEPGWITMSKATLPVYQTESPLGDSQLTYAEGEALCEKEGTVIASRSELREAQIIGLTYCHCGWISDGTNALVITTEQDMECWATDVNDITECPKQKSNVWCHLQ